MPGPKPLTPQLQPLLLYPSRLWAAFVWALFGIAVGVVSYGWLLLIALFRGATPLWLFGPPAAVIVLWMLFGAWQLRKRQPVVILDEDGITDFRLGERPVPWDDIAQFEVKLTSHGGTSLVVKFRDMEAARDHLGRLRTPLAWMDNRAYGGHWLVRLTSLRFDGAEVTRRANAFAARARTG
jgi:hypothetical protein